MPTPVSWMAVPVVIKVAPAATETTDARPPPNVAWLFPVAVNRPALLPVAESVAVLLASTSSAVLVPTLVRRLRKVSPPTLSVGPELIPP